MKWRDAVDFVNSPDYIVREFEYCLMLLKLTQPHHLGYLLSC